MREIKLVNASVRNRKSYKDFKDFLLMIRKENPVTNNEEEILTALFNLLDRKRAFGSETQSGYAKESLNLLLIDTGVI